MNTRLRLAAAGPLAAAVAAGTLAFAAPANAESAHVTDPVDASASLNDIRAVDVSNGAAKVRVKVKFTDLRRHSDAGPAGLQIFFDTFGGDSGTGPEYELATGLEEGTDYALAERAGWRGPTGDPLSCNVRLKLDYRNDELRAATPRRCLDRPEYLRVGVKMTDEYDGSHPVIDWMKGPRKWTRWLESA